MPVTNGTYPERERFPNGYPTRDWQSHRANEDLAKIIRRYWTNRGFEPPKITIIAVENYGKSTFAIGSDMVNGYPRKRKH